MATRISRNVVGSLKGRFRSTQAKTAAESISLPKQTPKVTKLPNGLVVASLENYFPVSRVAVVVNAGPRFESGDNLGVTHCLRIAGGLSTQHTTQFNITRSVEQTGGSLSVTSTRENMFYTINCTRDKIGDVFHFLREMTTAPAMKPWELSDFQPRLSLELAILKQEPRVQLAEMLHQAAFRNTLGNSLYAPEFMAGKYTSEQLMHYVSNNYTAGRMAIVGAGVDHDDLVSEAKKFTPFTSPGGSAEEPAKYHGGGEIRKHTDSPLAYAAVAVEGPSLAANDMIHAGVLQQVMGTGPYIKYSSNATVSKLGQAVAQATSEPFAVSCVNSSYSDGGLFGFTAIAQPDEIGKVLKAAFSQFAAVTKGTIKDAEVARAKKQLKMNVMMCLDSQEGVVNDLGEQAIGHQQVIDMQDIAQHIDAVTTADVVNVAKRIINGKPSMAAIGDLSNTPYLDELYK